MVSEPVIDGKGHSPLMLGSAQVKQLISFFSKYFKKNLRKKLSFFLKHSWKPDNFKRRSLYCHCDTDSLTRRSLMRFGDSLYHGTQQSKEAPLQRTSVPHTSTQMGTQAAVNTICFDFLFFCAAKGCSIWFPLDPHFTWIETHSDLRQDDRVGVGGGEREKGRKTADLEWHHA